jgi:hypothetical protein
MTASAAPTGAARFRTRHATRPAAGSATWRGRRQSERAPAVAADRAGRERRTEGGPSDGGAGPGEVPDSPQRRSRTNYHADRA